MKNSNNKLMATAISLFLIILLTSNKLFAQYFPDEETFDTSGLIQETLTDGLDTVWYWGIDGPTEGMNLKTEGTTYYQNSNNISQYSKVHADSTIYINLGSTQKSVNKGLYGFHIEGIYSRKVIPNDGSAVDQWQWMSELAPSSLRFPGGSSSKFMHLLDGPGYGYDIEEIIRFYDRTDSVVNAPSYISIKDSIEADAGALFYLTWITAKEVDDFIGFADKWVEQNLLDSNHLYIDDFVYMVKQIEVANPGQKVDVIIDLNIMNETATRSKEIVEYLRNHDTCNVNVVYVELGNEMYFSFSETMLGIYTLEDYWTYINGGITDSLDSVLIGTDVWFDHDYISTFKSSPLFTCKIGLPVENLKDPTYAFREAASSGIRAANEWNDDLFEKRLEKVEIEGLPGHFRKSFDAYIVHPYYDTHNWDTIALYNLDSVYECESPDTIGWRYDIHDPRLEDAFDGLAKNFKKFTNTRYQESWNVHRDTLGLNLSVSSGGKEIITSEYNFKETGGDYTIYERDKLGVFAQTFLTSAMLQEWWLKNLKINYNNSYREGFFKYATLHNFAGASHSAMLSPAFGPELDSLNRDTIPYNISTDSLEGRNYYMKRASYFTMLMLSDIPKNGLKYLQTNFTLAKNNINVQPTVFIDSEKENFYFYYSNVSADPQPYYINLTGTSGIFPPDGHVQITDTVTIYCVNALQPYSTGGRGKNTLYTINKCYNDINYNVDYNIEIDTFFTLTNSPSSGSPFTTVEVPAYSFGYFKVPIIADYPPYEKIERKEPHFLVFPNPSNQSISFSISGLEDATTSGLEVKITTIDGKICYKNWCSMESPIDISYLSSGIYLIFVEMGNGRFFKEKIIKQ
ncbi:MAG TPA: T9SS type A sorting domain-containing protein [Chitinophagales bacterium]|nr:T9SS type A sorting domain-containing protein [Chitinophagales bacterium]